LPTRQISPAKYFSRLDSVHMLLRVRSNVGTWKYSVEPVDRLSTVIDRICKGRDESPSTAAWEVSQPLSRDPAGKQPLALDQTLNELGIDHGAMVYCRVEPSGTEASTRDTASASTKSSSLSNVAASDSTAHAKERTIIDLLDSDDDDDVPDTSKTKKRQWSSSGTASEGPTELSKAKKTKPTASSSMSQPHPSKFQIVSYNVWFGPPDSSVNQLHPEERMAAIARELESCQDNLLFVGFQELTESLRVYLEPHLKRMGYRFCTQPLGGAYGVGLAISKRVTIVESKFLPFGDSCQGRGLLYVQTPTMLFGTTHLESYIDAKEYNGATQREAQIVQAATFCQERLRQNPNLQLAMIAGDFNWDDERKRKGTSPNTELLPLLHTQSGDMLWKDAGTPFDYTYDGKENPMLGSNLRRRFDRCIYLQSSPSKATTTAQLHKLGMTAIPSLTWNKRNPFNGSTKVVPVAPSDHFGIAVTFQTK